MALRDLGGRQERILERASSLGLLQDPLPEFYRPASEESLDALAREPLVTLGCHTWSHIDLTTVPRPEAEDELRGSLAWLKERSPSGPPFMSYPYGAFHEGIKGLIEEVGFEAAFLVTGGPTRLRDVRRNPLSIPRLGVSRYNSLEGFQARISGAWTA